MSTAPDHMFLASGGRHAASVLTHIADDWGYGCEVSSVDRRSADMGRSPLVEGLIATYRLPCGLNVCASELETLQDNDRAGVVQHCMTIALNLDGSAVSYALCPGIDINLAASRAIAIAARDEVRMASSYRKGDKSRVLVVQASPLHLADRELAEQLETCLRTTAAMPLTLSVRSMALARELFAPRHTGIVGRLLAESCALELLAAAIAAQGQIPSQTASSIHPRDVKKIGQVRDKLLANLDADFCLDDLARETGMSMSALKSKFAAVVGQPVFQFLRDRRLDRAREGLEREGWTVAQAAYYVGYRHASNFATAFRRRFGVAPKGLRPH